MLKKFTYPVLKYPAILFFVLLGSFFLGCDILPSSDTVVMDKAVFVNTVSPEEIAPSGETDSIVWAKTIGNEYAQYITSIESTPEGGFIAAGHTRESKERADDVWVVKLNKNLNVIWSKAFSASYNEYAYALIPTADSGFVFAGEKRFYSILDEFNITPSYKYDAYIVKLDGDGNILWEKNHGGSDYDCANDIRETADGGFIVCGYTQSYGANYTPDPHAKKDLWIIKLDHDGNMLWDFLFGEEDGSDSAYAIEIADDGGYVATGFTASHGAGGYDCLVLKISEEGVLEWSKTFGGVQTDIARSIQKTEEGDFIIAGETASEGNGHTDCYIIKIDGQGNLIWETTIGSEKFERGYCVKTLSDKTILVSGYTNSSGAGSNDFLLIRLNEDGSVLSEKILGGYSYDQLNAMIPLSDGSVIAAGPTSSFGAGDIDMLLLKIDF